MSWPWGREYDPEPGLPPQEPDRGSAVDAAIDEGDYLGAWLEHQRELQLADEEPER